MNTLLLLLLPLLWWPQANQTGTTHVSGQAAAQGTGPITVTGISISPQNASAVVPNITNYTATATLSNGVTSDITAFVNWSSTSPVIASVGVLSCTPGCAMPVTCNSAGAAQVQATFGTLLFATSTLSCTSQPPPPPSLVSIAVTPPNPNVNVGQFQLFTATGTYSDGTTKDITSGVTWASSSTAVATMGGLGPAQQANCILGGNTSISATDPATSIAGSTTLNCTAVLTAIAVAPSVASILVGNTQQFSATCHYNDGTTQNCNGVTWGSLNNSIATINQSGLAVGQGTGTVTITATIGTIQGTASLTVTPVTPPPTLTSITVTPANATINTGANLVYTATCNYSDGSTQNCTLNSGMVWASSSTGVATISSIAVASGVSAGTTTISATYQTITGTTGLTVQTPIPTLVSIQVTPTNPTQTNGSSILFTATGTYSDGSTQNITTSAAWSLGTGGIATIQAQSGGTQPVQCNNTGSTTVVATLNAITGNTTLNCTPPVVITGEDAYCGTNSDISCFTGNQTDGPAQLPTHGMYTSLNGTPSPGSAINVNSQASLTAALSAVTCGQQIVMDASVTYSNFTIPAKGCSGSQWIFIETNQTGAPGFPAEHQQITPCASNQTSVANYPNYTCGSPSQLMAKVVCTSAVSGGCVVGASGFDHVRLIGLDIFCNPASTVFGECVTFPLGGNHFIMDRTLVHGPAYGCTQTGGVYTCPGADLVHGVNFSNLTYAAFNNGWIYNVGTGGSNSDAIALILGGNSCSLSEDVKKSYNSLLSSTGEAFFSGGNGCGSGTITPNDFEIRNYHTFKPVVWMQCNGSGNGAGCHGAHPEVKNNGELKNANRVLLEGGVCENSWSSWQTDQDGYCHLLTPKNQATAQTLTGVSSDSTGTILTGNFSAQTASPNCAPGGCHVLFNGITTKVQSYSAGPPVTVTVAPAVTASLSGQTVTSYLPGLNPNATVTNVTMRYLRIMNSRNGIQLAAATSDGGDLPAALNAISIHDIQMEGINPFNVNGLPGVTGGGQCIQEQNGFAPPRNLHNWLYEHNTCAVFIPGAAFSHSASDHSCDASDTTGAGTGNMTGRVVRNNIGPSGGVTSFNQCSSYPGTNSLNTNIVKQSGSSWVFTKNVLGVGMWTSQTNGLPFPASNADPTDTPAGTGCGTGNATCHPSGSLWPQVFISYNGPGGKVGFLGDYQLNPGSPYKGQATDSTDIGVSNYTTWNTKQSGVYAATTYTPAAITTGPTLPAATVGSPYTTALLATSASPAQNWFLTGTSSLPPGLSLSITAQPGNWAITGTPTTGGSYSFNLEMLDMAQQFSTQTFTMVVNGTTGAGPNWAVAAPNPAGCSNVKWIEFRKTAGGGGVANEWYEACASNSVYKSTNQGASWTNIQNNATWTVGPFTIQVNPHDGSLIMGTQSTAAASQVLWWRSTNDGASWTQVLPTGRYHNTAAGSHQGCALPNASSTRLACGGLFGSVGTSEWYSDNDGVTAITTGTGTSSSTYALTRNPSNSGCWLGSETAGVWEAPDCVTWTQQLATCPSPCSGTYGNISAFAWTTSGDTLFAAQGGVYKSSGTLGSLTWTKTLTTNQGQFVYTDSLGSNYYIHQGNSQFPRSIYRSTNSGASFTAWDTGMPAQTTCSNIIENPFDGKIYASCGSLYSSPK